KFLVISKDFRLMPLLLLVYKRNLDQTKWEYSVSMPHHNLCYEFGPYQLNVNTRGLKRSGETISLTPKSAEILVLLVTRAGQFVEKDELLKEVWPDTFVEEANLSQN